MTEKKKPRTRKLERDRAREQRADEKKSSTRHEAAKKAAKATRVKAAKSSKSPAKGGPKAAGDSTATPTKHSARKPAATDRPAKRSDARPARRHASDAADRPAKRPGRRLAEPTRGDDRRERGSGGRPSTRPARATTPRDTDARPARAPRAVMSRDTDARPARAPRVGERGPDRGRATDRPSARGADHRPERRTTFRDDDRPPRRASSAERPTTARKTERRHVDAEHAHRAPKASRAVDVDDANDFEVDSAAWADMGIADQFLPVLKRMRLAAPFAIQTLTLPDAVAGRDVLGRAQTGSGKTLAFGLAMLTRLAGSKAKAHKPLGLVMVPTRELAMQVTDALMPFAQSVGLDIRLIAGGMPYNKQIDALRRAVPVLVATPGRLNDLIAQGHVDLSQVQVTVLDEADQMCDMGFAPQIIEALDETPDTSQRLLFSATLDGDVDAIVRRYLRDPVEHATASSASKVSTMEHYLFVVYSEDKPTILAQIGSRPGKTIVFGRTQLGVERMAGELAKQGVACGALHGGKTQGARTRTLAEFKEGVTHVLVATDVAARGIHVDGVSLVVHADPPRDPKDYVHRAGRTARAGEEGAVVTLIGPRQQKSVQSMMARAGVTPEVVRVRSMGADMVRITGAREPSGVPWHPPAQPKSKSGPRRGGDQGRGRRPASARTTRPRRVSGEK